jgi:LPS sulfotransferase NodH
MLGVGGDMPDKVLVPKFEKQSDEMNADWIDRYRREA